VLVQTNRIAEAEPLLRRASSIEEATYGRRGDRSAAKLLASIART